MNPHLTVHVLINLFFKGTIYGFRLVGYFYFMRSLWANLIFVTWIDENLLLIELVNNQRSTEFICSLIKFKKKKKL